MKRQANDVPVDNASKQPKQRVLCWSSGDTKCHRLSDNELGKLVLDMVTESLLPVSFVEQPSFRRLINACQPGVALPSRYSITRGLEKSRENSIAAVKEAMSKIEWIATTTDCWSAHRRSYLGVTAHWINPNNFKRESAALACRRLTGSHTYQLLAEQLKSVQ